MIKNFKFKYLQITQKLKYIALTFSNNNILEYYPLFMIPDSWLFII